MSTESAPSALQRFARDLRRIREQREISVSALSEATQVPQPHIEEFEEGTLYEQSRMNAVYLKAFVRAYAETLEIPANAVIEQLEAALEGEYDNQLAAQFLGEPSETSGQQSSATESSSSSGRDRASMHPDDVASDGDSADPEDGSGEDASSDSELEAPENTSDERGKGQAEPTEPGSFSPPSSPGSRDSSSSRRRAPSQSSASGAEIQRVWNQYGGAIISVALILLVLAIGGGLASLYFGGGGEGGSSASTASVDRTDQSVPPDTSEPADTAETDTSALTRESASVQSRRPPANVELGDTLYAVVEATSVVAGLRVQQDDDLRRPYWIEEGEARVFPFTRRITVENQLDSLRLFLENYPYPTTRTNEEGQIVISRDTAEQFVDTLRGDPASFPTPSDTVEIRPAGGSDADTLAQIQ